MLDPDVTEFYQGLLRNRLPGDKKPLSCDQRLQNSDEEDEPENDFAGLVAAFNQAPVVAASEADGDRSNSAAHCEAMENDDTDSEDGFAGLKALFAKTPANTALQAMAIENNMAAAVDGSASSEPAEHQDKTGLDIVPGDHAPADREEKPDETVAAVQRDLQCIFCKAHKAVSIAPHSARDCTYLACGCKQCVDAELDYEASKFLTKFSPDVDSTYEVEPLSEIRKDPSVMHQLIALFDDVGVPLTLREPPTQ